MSRGSGGCHTHAVRLPARAVGSPTGQKALCERSEPLSDSVSAGCRRLLGAMSLLHRQIVGRNFLCCHTGRCEDQTLRERGKNKIRQKSAISAVALSWRHRAAFWGNAANVLFAPSPYGFLLALLIHAALSCAASCGAFGATVRTSCSHPLPLPLCRFFTRLVI